MEYFCRHLADWLPERLETAAANYRRFTAVAPPEDTKAFAAHQLACRGSLTHLHLLMRLARWTESACDPSRVANEVELDRLFDEAEVALKNQSLDGG